MEGGESLLDEIFEGDLEDYEDVEMLDVEEGELVQQTSETKFEQSTGADVHVVNEESSSKNKRPRRKRKKNKQKRGGSGPNITDINRFVVDVCKRIRETKSYLVWSAVARLGVSALSDLVKEVDAIQKCGGQKTADGRRFRNGGGILWTILKERDVAAYKEIMKKGKEFEKQLKQQFLRKAPVDNEEYSSNINALPTKDQTKNLISDDPQLASNMRNQVFKY